MSPICTRRRWFETKAVEGFRSASPARPTRGPSGCIAASMRCWGSGRQHFKAEGNSHGMTEANLTVSADGSRVFFEGRGHLSMSSGKTYRNRYVRRFDLVGGKIKRCQYYNPIQSAYAFGRKIASQFAIETL
jgi:hypothetical protein